jgi:hypothetical protein
MIVFYQASGPRSDITSSGPVAHLLRRVGNLFNSGSETRHDAAIGAHRVDPAAFVCAARSGLALLIGRELPISRTTEGHRGRTSSEVSAPRIRSTVV